MSTIWQNPINLNTGVIINLCSRWRWSSQIQITLFVEVDFKCGFLTDHLNLLMFTAFSFQCYKCFGNSDVCNNNTLEPIECLAGQDKCLSMKVERDGKETRLHGCATQNDCDTSVKSCESAASGRTNCETECCATSNCNMPPCKGNISCEVMYEMFHILNCGVEVKWAMIIAVMNAI